jgi:hypothetical protein
MTLIDAGKDKMMQVVVTQAAARGHPLHSE